MYKIELRFEERGDIPADIQHPLSLKPTFFDNHTQAAEALLEWINTTNFESYRHLHDVIRLTDDVIIPLIKGNLRFRVTLVTKYYIVHICLCKYDIESPTELNEITDYTYGPDTYAGIMEKRK